LYVKKARKWHYEKSLRKQKGMICLQSDFFEFKRAKALVQDARWCELVQESSNALKR
jgi:hypothetical protein